MLNKFECLQKNGLIYFLNLLFFKIFNFVKHARKFLFLLLASDSSEIISVKSDYITEKLRF